MGNFDIMNDWAGESQNPRCTLLICQTESAALPDIMKDNLEITNY